jgi:hypothetical protein
MPLRRVFLRESLLQNLLGMTSTYPALPAYAQAALQVAHPVSAPMDSLANRSIGYTFADTNVHITVPGHLFGQDKLVVASKPQAIMLALVLNNYFVTL